MEASIAPALHWFKKCRESRDIKRLRLKVHLLLPSLLDRYIEED